MKKDSELRDNVRPEYDLSQLKGGVRGKYYRRASAGTNLVPIEPDLAILFPNAEAVNRALRVLAEAAQSTTAPKRRRARQVHNGLKCVSHDDTSVREWWARQNSNL